MLVRWPVNVSWLTKHPPPTTLSLSLSLSHPLPTNYVPHFYSLPRLNLSCMQARHVDVSSHICMWILVDPRVDAIL